MNEHCRFNKRNSTTEHCSDVISINVTGCGGAGGGRGRGRLGKNPPELSEQSKVGKGFYEAYIMR